MKRFMSVLVIAVLAFMFTGCGTMSNNGIMQAMGSRTNYNADLCDQERADVCKQFPELENAFGLTKTFFVIRVYQGDMTKQEVLDMIDKAIALSMTRGFSSGQILRHVFKDPKDMMLFVALCEQLGVNVDFSLNSDYLLDTESKALVVDRLVELKTYMERVLVDDKDNVTS
jgi:hypothetical protein